MTLSKMSETGSPPSQGGSRVSTKTPPETRRSKGEPKSLGGRLSLTTVCGPEGGVAPNRLLFLESALKS